MTATRQVKVAILNLYNGLANNAIASFENLLQRYAEKHGLKLVSQVFKVRQGNQLPGTDWDIYISSGGPGSPFSQDEEWDKNYFKLVEALKTHNAVEGSTKKHILFVCHSFQLLCRQYGLGEVSLRNMPSFGIVPERLTNEGADDLIFKNMPDPFYAVDSRSWQVINPDKAAFEKIGAKILAIENERPNGLRCALMAIRINDYFVATQFHPEAGPDMMRARLLMADNKQQVIDERGEAGYEEMVLGLDDLEKLALTYNAIIANFLDGAMAGME